MEQVQPNKAGSAAPLKVVITMPLGVRLGGAENILWTFLQHVDRRRIDPLVVFLDDGPFVAEVASLGIQAVMLRAGRLRDMHRFAATTRSLARLLRQNEPDLVLNWMAKSQLYGSLAAVTAGMSGPVVWWQQGIPEGHWLDRLATLLPARAVGCYSQAAAKAQSSLRPRRATFVVAPGIDAPPRHLAVDGLRERLSISHGEAVIGIVGRLQPWKGQHRVLGAVAELRRRGHPVHGLIVGGTAHNFSPEYEPYLHRLVEDLGIQGHVSFTGQVRNAAPYLELMDVMVNASDPEPFGIVLLEAMAQGVAVVAVRSGGPAEIIQDGDSGLLIESPEQVVMADTLERLIVDDDLRGRIARAGHHRFEQRFSAERMTHELQARLEEFARQ
jgi:glycosyltransferase involved in cell wall biosynthesis